MVLIPALFIGFYGHVAAIVAYTVTGTTGVSDDDQGLAAGLTSMTQLHLALSFDVALTLVSVILVWLGLRPRTTKIDGCRPQPVVDRQRVEMV